MHGNSSGFTLIEMAVTMVIVAIIAAIAIPSYSNYALRAHRTDAKTALLDLASLEERYYSVNNTYTLAPANLGYTAFPQTVGSGYYQVSVSNVNPPALGPPATPATYLLTATAFGTQVKDTQCQTFTLNQQGVQTATPDPNNSCWH